MQFKKSLCYSRSYLGPERAPQRLGNGFRSLDVGLLRIDAADPGLVALLLFWVGEEGGSVTRTERQRTDDRGGHTLRSHGRFPRSRSLTVYNSTTHTRTLMMMKGLPNSSNARLIVAEWGRGTRTCGATRCVPRRKHADAFRVL